MFISFEGIDGSGKSTQLTLLRSWLEERGRQVITVREPGATALSESIRSILLSNKHSITAAAELLLFSAARVQLVEKVIVPELDAGKIVLCDRYADSTTAYQGYGRMLPMADVDTCNKLATKDVMPSITVLIDVPYEQAQLRMNFHAGDGPDRMERSGPEFFERVRAGYLYMAKLEPERFLVLDGLQDRQSLHRAIVCCVQDRLRALAG